jgi:transposase
MVSKTIIVVWSLICGWVLIGVLFDAISDATPGINIPLMVFYQIIVWAAVIVPTALIGLLFKRSGRSQARFEEAPPMWTNMNRGKNNRDHLRHPSDLTDDEWALVEPFIPPAKSGGRKRRDMRAVMNGVMYILSTGYPWRYLPKDFPPRSTVHNYFIWWQRDGVLDRIHDALCVGCREKAERDAFRSSTPRAFSTFG